MANGTRTIADLLSEFGGETKTASDAATQAPANTSEITDVNAKIAQKREEIADLLGGSEKTASQNGGAVDDSTATLQKLAQEMAAANEAARIKEAQLYGAAVFDGFLRRAHEYSNANQQTLSKEAAAQQASTEQERRQGYQDMDAALSKLASDYSDNPVDARARAYQAEIQKYASAGMNAFGLGFDMVVNILQGG